MAGLTHREIRYGTASELQTVDVWELPESERISATASDRYWFIYIHGGAWRDPRCLADTAVPAINRLLTADSPYVSRSRIAGFASIGYRLSPHPEFPQDPVTTPAAQLRVAHHPDHIDDVRAGLAALARDGASASGSPADYLAHERYIVYGHSCGAFLAFQLWMGGDEAPPCVIGLEGIYDLRGFVERGGSPMHGGGPGTGFAAALETIAEGAFGSDRTVWDATSPGRYDYSKLGAGKTKKTRLALVAYSPEDELVDSGEMDTIEKALQQSAAQSDGRLRYFGLRDLHGKHDEVHEDGRDVVRVLTEAVRHLDSL